VKLKRSLSREGEGSTSVETVEKVGLSGGESGAVLLKVVVVEICNRGTSVCAVSP
jgi:hypothetical protein